MSVMSKKKVAATTTRNDRSTNRTQLLRFPGCDSKNAKQLNKKWGEHGQRGNNGAIGVYVGFSYALVLRSTAKELL